MSADATRYLDLLEQRIALLNSLAEALVSARGSIAGCDIDGLEARIAGQQQLCAEISALDSEIERVQRHCALQLLPLNANGSADASSGGSGSTPQAARIRETIARLRVVQSHVQQLNDAHKILLQRSRRTVTALLNSYHTFATTYANPAVPRATLGEMV